MRHARTRTVVLPVLLAPAIVLAGCGGSSDRGAVQEGEIQVPDDIVQVFLSHPHFSVFQTEPADLKWRVYEEEDSRRIVAARLGRRIPAAKKATTTTSWCSDQARGG